MKTFTIAAAIALAGSATLAAGTGDHGHASLPVGAPGKPAAADRTVDIRMIETDTGMAFEPAELAVGQGETVLFKVTNAGVLDHEIVLGTAARNHAHMMEMAGTSDMHHDDPNALRLSPGDSGELAWTFENDGTFQFACLIPGHFDAGMHGPIRVN